MGSHPFQGAEAPCGLDLPSSPENPARFQTLAGPHEENHSPPSVSPTSPWQTVKAQGESVGEVISPVENGLTIANLSLRHLKDNSK